MSEPQYRPAGPSIVLKLKHVLEERAKVGSYYQHSLMSAHTVVRPPAGEPPAERVIVCGACGERVPLRVRSRRDTIRNRVIFGLIGLGLMAAAAGILVFMVSQPNDDQFEEWPGFLLNVVMALVFLAGVSFVFGGFTYKGAAVIDVGRASNLDADAVMSAIRQGREDRRAGRPVALHQLK
jgi:hypothetical protein